MTTHEELLALVTEYGKAKYQEALRGFPMPDDARLLEELRTKLNTLGRQLETACHALVEIDDDYEALKVDAQRGYNLHRFLSSLPYANSPITVAQVLDNWKTVEEQFERRRGLRWTEVSSGGGLTHIPDQDQQPNQKKPT